MEESSTYQFILSKGAWSSQGSEEVHSSCRPPSLWSTRCRDNVTTIDAITDIERLEQLAERLLDVSSWQELLTPLHQPVRGATFLVSNPLLIATLAETRFAALSRKEQTHHGQ